MVQGNLVNLSFMINPELVINDGNTQLKVLPSQKNTVWLEARDDKLNHFPFIKHILHAFQETNNQSIRVDKSRGNVRTKNHTS